MFTVYLVNPDRNSLYPHTVFILENYCYVIREILIELSYH